MDPHDNTSVPTRIEFITLLRSPEDQSSLQQFFDRYWRPIYFVALKAGLTGDEAQELVQETMVAAAKQVPGLQCEPEVLSLKKWLLRLTRRQIIQQMRKRVSTCEPMLIPLNDDASETALLHQLTGGAAPDLEKTWADEWEKGAR